MGLTQDTAVVAQEKWNVAHSKFQVLHIIFFLQNPAFLGRVFFDLQHRFSVRHPSGVQTLNLIKTHIQIVSAGLHPLASRS